MSWISLSLFHVLFLIKISPLCVCSTSFTGIDALPIEDISAPSLSLFSSNNPKAYNEDSGDTLFVDGKSDCTNGGPNCTSLSQAYETLPELTEEDTTTVIYKFILGANISDTTERPLFVRHSIHVTGINQATVSVTNATTPTSRFCTMGAANLTADITVTFVNVDFTLYGMGNGDAVTGTPFRIETTVAGNVDLTLDTFTVTSGNADGSQYRTAGPFVRAMRGSLTIISVSFSKAILSKTAFIICNNASLYIEGGTSFTSITGTGVAADDGSAIRGILEEGRTFVIIGCKFTDCVNYRRGGAVSLWLNGGSLTLGGMKYSQEIQFDACRAYQGGGALYIQNQAQIDFRINRMDYAACSADTGIGTNLIYDSPHPLDSAEWLPIISELIKSQETTHGSMEFMAFNNSATQEPDVTDSTSVINLSSTSALYAYDIQLDSHGSATCTYAGAGQQTLCSTLAQALFVSRSSSLPVGNKITVSPNTLLSPSNFTAAAAVSCAIDGNDNEVVAGLTNLLSAPLITVGPTIVYDADATLPAGLTQRGSDSEIIFSLSNLVVSLERTEAVFLREILFKVTNTITTVHADGTNTTSKSSSMHYFQLTNVVIQSGLTPDLSGSIPQAYTTAPLIQADDDTYLMLDSLTVKNLYLISNIEACPSVISSPSAACVLRRCHFETITLEAAPLLDISTAPCGFGFEMPADSDVIALDTVSSFHNISRKEGNGAVFSVDLSGELSATLSISKSYFARCSAESGNGGVISITGLSSAEQVTFEDLIFSGCAASLGSCLYVTTETATIDELRETWTALETEIVMNNDYQIKIGLADPIPLFDRHANVYHILVDRDNGNDDGNADGQCGSPATIPCKTIYMAYTNRLPTTTTIVMAAGEYEADLHPITLVSTITIKGGTSSPTFFKKPVKTVKGGLFVIPETLTEGSITFTYLTFTLQSEEMKPGITGYTESTLTSPIICSNSPASITLAYVAIQMADVTDANIYEPAPISSSVIIVTVGSLVLDNVECRSLTLDSGSPLISTSTGTQLVLRECVFEDITLRTRNLIESSNVASELVFEGTNKTFTVFQNIHRLSGNGAVMQKDVGGQYGLNLAYCHFINCTSDETEAVDGVTINAAFGGAIYLNLLGDDGVLTYDPATVSFSLTDSPTGTLADDGTTFVPDFDASFNAPWKSAITIATTNGSLIGTARSGYAKTLIDADSAWQAASSLPKYYVFILDEEGERAYNSTLFYALSNNIADGNVATITPTGGDVPGCGLIDSNAIPCATIKQTIVNLRPTSNTQVITLTEGTHRGVAFYDTELATPVTISGTVVRGFFKTFVTLSNPCFVTSTLREPPVIQDMSITTLSGDFVVNTGDGGFSLARLTFSGVPKATAAQRLYSPLLSSTAGNITLDTIICTQIALKDCVLSTFTDGAVCVKDSSFTSIVGRSPGTGGTVITTLITTLSSFIVTNTTFTGCHSQTNGGALSISIRTSGLISFDTVTFANCSAVGNGGSIYIFASQKFSELGMSSVTFEGAGGTDAEAYAAYGSYMLYQSDTVAADLAYLDVEFIVRTYRLAESQFMVNQSTGGSPLNMYALQTHICIGGKNSSEERSCGSEEQPCTSLVTAMDCAIYDGDCYFFYVAPEYIPAADVHIRVHRNLFIYGITETNDSSSLTSTILVASVPDGVRSTRIPIEANAEATFDEPLFNVLRATWLWGNLEMNMTNIAFAVISSELTPGQMKNPFLRAVGETIVSLDSVIFTTNNTKEEVLLLHSIFDVGNILVLELYDVYFTHLTINDSAVLNIPVRGGSDFTVNSLSTFEYITRKHGNGAVLSEVLTKDSLLTFCNVKFSGCVCEDGCGGAVYIDYQGGRLVIGDYADEETGSYQPTLFVGCSASVAGGACYFNFSSCNEAPAVADEEGEDPAENLFLLQNTVFEGKNNMTTGIYAYAEGKTGVVDDITLWKYLIPLSSTAGEFQYYLNDAQSGTEALQDIYSIIPSHITVNPFRADGPYCSECNTIGAAMQTYASFATHIILDFTWRDGNMPTSLFHDVLIVGVSTASIIYLPNTHATESVYFVVDVPRTEIILRGFNFIYNLTNEVYEKSVRFVLVDNGATVQFDRMKFTDNTAGLAIHAGTIVDASNGKVVFADCAFNTITLDSSPLLAVSTKPDWFIMEGHNLFNTIKQANSTFYTGGTLIDVTFEGGDGIKINGANFSACTTSISGSLLYFNILDAPDAGAFVLSNNYYFAAGAAEGERGNKLDDTRIAIIVTSLTDFVQVNGELWTSLVNGQSSASKTFVWLSEAIPEGSCTPIDELPIFDLCDYRYYTYYVDPFSTIDDNTQCEKASQCPYLHYAADLSNKVGVEHSYINIAEGTLDNKGMQASLLRSCTVAGAVSDVGRLTTLNVTLEGTGLLSLIAVGISKTRMQATDCTIKDFLVSVTSTSDAVPYVPVFGVISQYSLTARLILDSIAFSLNTDIGSRSHAPLETSLISATAGFLRLVDCEFDSFVMTNYPLIQASPFIYSGGDCTTGLEFWGTNYFTNNTRNVGSGGVFHFDMKDNSNLMLANCTFNLNSAPVGGCIYIEVLEQVVNATYSWDCDSLVFSTQGTFDEGSYIYIYVEQLQYVSEPYLEIESRLTFYQADLKDAYVLKIHTPGYEGTYQFYEVHETITNEVLIVSEQMGYYNLLSDAIDAFYADTTKRRIFLKRHLTDNPLPMVVSRDLSISGLFDDRSRPYIPIIGLESDMYTVVASTQSVSLTINDLAFHLNSTNEHPILAALFTTSGERASLITAQCSFDSVDGGMAVPIAVPIYGAYEGTLGISKCTYANLVMASTALITLPSILANFGVYTTSSFTNITRNNGNGAVFEPTVDASDTLTLKNMNFVNCSTLSGHGGAIYATLRFRSSLIFQRLSFDSCSAKGSIASTRFTSHAHSLHSTPTLSISNDDEPAKGGAVFVYVSGQPDGWTVTDTSITSCTAADAGQAFYLHTAAINNPGSFFWTTALVGLTGAVEGDVVALVNTDGVESTQDLYQYTIPPTLATAAANTSSGTSDGVATWIIIVIIASSLVTLVAGIALIVLCCRKHS